MSLQKEKFYCVKCRVKKEQKPEVVRHTKSDRYMLASKCTKCGLQMYKFTGKDKIETKYKELEIEEPPVTTN